MKTRSWCARLAGAAALSTALATPAAASAQGFGSLNPGFGSTGVVLSTGAKFVGVASDPSGDAIAVGQNNNNIIVEKLTPSGSVAGTYTGGPGIARAVTVQSNGDIVIAGALNGAFFVERLTPALTPDTSFGNNGVATAFSGQTAVANGVAVTPTGAIVAGGSSTPPNTSAVVAEFTSAGALNPSFGSGGTTTITGDFTAFNGGYGVINSLAAEPNGLIAYVGQQTTTQGITNGVIGVLNANGSTSSFNSGGPYHYTPAGGSSGYTSFESIAVAPGNQLLVGGVDYGGQHALLLRYNAGGGLDSSFANGGVNAISAAGATSPNSAVGAYGVALGGANTVIGSGMFDTTATNQSGALWGLLSSGALDSGFGSGGSTLAPAGSSQTPYEGCAIAVAPNGTIYTVGYTPTAAPDPSPCSTSAGSGGGYVASFIGNGPAPSLTAPAPAVSAGTAAAVTSTSATVNGSVNAEGLSTTYVVRYGTSPSYGAQTASASAGSGTSPATVSAALTNLAPGTTYHYQVVATNASGTTAGPDATFTTATAGSGGGGTPGAPGAPGAPGVFTGVSQKVGETGATVFGRVSPNGLATSYFWEFDWTTKYRRHTQIHSAGSGTATTIYAVNLSHLAAGHVYHYRLVAVSAAGTAYGQDRTFRTAPALRVSLGVGSTTTLAGRKLVIGITCNAGCSAYGTLTLWRSYAGRLGYGNRSVRLAGRSATLGRGGHGTLTLFVSPADFSRLARERGVGATLQVTFRPTAGGPSVTFKRTIRIDA